MAGPEEKENRPGCSEAFDEEDYTFLSADDSDSITAANNRVVSLSSNCSSGFDQYSSSSSSCFSSSSSFDEEQRKNKKNKKKKRSKRVSYADSRFPGQASSLSDDEVEEKLKKDYDSLTKNRPSSLSLTFQAQRRLRRERMGLEVTIPDGGIQQWLAEWGEDYKEREDAREEEQWLAELREKYEERGDACEEQHQQHEQHGDHEEGEKKGDAQERWAVSANRDSDSESDSDIRKETKRNTENNGKTKTTQKSDASSWKPLTAMDFGKYGNGNVGDEKAPAFSLADKPKLSWRKTKKEKKGSSPLPLGSPPPPPSALPPSLTLTPPTPSNPSSSSRNPSSFRLSPSKEVWNTVAWAMTQNLSLERQDSERKGGEVEKKLVMSQEGLEVVGRRVERMRDGFEGLGNLVDVMIQLEREEEERLERELMRWGIQDCGEGKEKGKEIE